MTVYTAYYTLVNPYKYRSILNPKHQVIKAFYPSFVLSLQLSLLRRKTEPPMKQGLFRKGFLNLPPIVSVPPASPREVNDVAVAGPSSSPKGCIIPPSVEGNGFSQSRNWPVSFDQNGEIVVWDEEDDYWDGLGVGWGFRGGGHGNLGCHGRRFPRG